MARHSGPLLLYAEDVEDITAGSADEKDETTSDTVASQSSSINEPVEPSNAAHSVENRQAQNTSPAKSMKSYDRLVRITRDQRTVQQSSSENVGSIVSAPARKSPAKSNNESTDHPSSSSPMVSNVGAKSSRKYSQKVIRGDRKSRRRESVPKNFNVAKIQCSVCTRSFWENVPSEFFDEPIACSWKCLRFNACI